MNCEGCKNYEPKVQESPKSEHKDGERCELSAYSDNHRRPDAPHHFEYTGEYRAPKKDEWMVSRVDTIQITDFDNYDSNEPREILRLVIDKPVFKSGDIVAHDDGMVGKVIVVTPVDTDKYKVCVRYADQTEHLHLSQSLHHATMADMDRYKEDKWTRRYDGVSIRAYMVMVKWQNEPAIPSIKFLIREDDGLVDCVIMPRWIGEKFCDNLNPKLPIYIPTEGEEPVYPLARKESSDADV